MPKPCRAYLASRGIAVPAKVGKGRIGNSNFNVKDPDGHTVEIVQYEPNGWTIRDKGKALDGPRISTRMTHVGILVGALEPAMKFYRDILGFEEIWRGSRDNKRLDWVNLRFRRGPTTSNSCSTTKSLRQPPAVRSTTSP